MTFLLLIILLIQLGCILYLGKKLLAERNHFDSKLKPLEELRLELDGQQKKRLAQLRLSNDLKNRMKEVNEVLSKNVYEFQYQILEDLYPKKQFDD